MIDIVFALTPIFVLILLGFGLKHRKLLAGSFWEPAETLTYYVFFPALMIKTTANADLGTLDVAPMMVALVAATILVAALSVKSKGLLRLEGPEFTSLFQGVIRPNSYIAIAGALALWGEPGLTLVAVAVIAIVPLVNFLSVIVMETYGAHEVRNEGLPRFAQIFKSILKNPIIIACCIGILMNVLGIKLPVVLNSLVDILGRAALPVGLLCVGAGLNLAIAKQAGRTVMISSLVKLMTLPLITLLCCIALGIEGITRDVAVFYAGMPVAASAYVLARQMGGDAPVMAGIITLTTLLAMITLPILLSAINLL